MSPLASFGCSTRSILFPQWRRRRPSGVFKGVLESLKYIFVLYPDGESAAVCVGGRYIADALPDR